MEALLFKLYLIIGGLMLVGSQVYISLTDSGDNDARASTTLVSIFWPLALACFVGYCIIRGSLYELPILIQKKIRWRIAKKKLAKPITTTYQVAVPKEKSVQGVFRGDACEKCGQPKMLT